MRSGLADESKAGQSLGVMWVKESLIQGPPPVPQLDSEVRIAGEGGRVSSGAQAQPLRKITLPFISTAFL